jgi:hypothetical protein
MISSAVKQMELKIIMLSEICQTQKVKYHKNGDDDGIGT